MPESHRASEEEAWNRTSSFPAVFKKTIYESQWHLTKIQRLWSRQDRGRLNTDKMFTLCQSHSLCLERRHSWGAFSSSKLKESPHLNWKGCWARCWFGLPLGTLAKTPFLCQTVSWFHLFSSNPAATAQPAIPESTTSITTPSSVRLSLAIFPQSFMELLFSHYTTDEHATLPRKCCHLNIHGVTKL